MNSEDSAASPGRSSGTTGADCPAECLGRARAPQSAAVFDKTRRWRHGGGHGFLVVGPGRKGSWEKRARFRSAIPDLIEAQQAAGDRLRNEAAPGGVVGAATGQAAEALGVAAGGADAERAVAPNAAGVNSVSASITLTARR